MLVKKRKLLMHQLLEIKLTRPAAIETDSAPRLLDHKLEMAKEVRLLLPPQLLRPTHS